MIPVPSIAGAFLRDLRWIADDRGALSELYRDSWEPPGTFDFGSAVPTFSRVANAGRARQVYLTETRPGVVKAWHFHREQTDRFVPVRGTLRVVLYDARELSPTRGGWFEVVLDPDRAHRMLVIPPGVVHGWKNVGTETASIMNCVTTEWTGSDEFRRGADEGPVEGVPYDWHARRDG